MRLIFSLLLIAGGLWAQTGGINGVITDQTSASVPDAEVTVTNLLTGLERKVKTNEAGNYTVPLLPVGRYKITAFKQGFSTETQNDLKLDVQQIARINFVLKPGSLVETVNVSASAALIESESSMVGQMIDNKRIIDLPLNGRNYLDLALLTTGTAPDKQGRTSDEGGFSASGQHQYQVNVTVDGLDNTTRASGGPLGYEAQAVKPSVDAVEEFRVVTNNLSAEFGYRMGGQIFVTTKSGTNQIHGTLYEFMRNDKLDGTNFFANRSGSVKPAYKRNQFGATMGGPIRRDKTFIFGSYEGSRIRVGNSFISSVPSERMRNGDFSESGVRPIFDPLTTSGTGAAMTRRQFPGNIIPKDRFDPVAVKLISLYPLPALPGIVNNYFYAPSETNDSNTYDFKGDHSLNNSSRFSLRYSHRGKDRYEPGPLPLPADGGLATTTNINANSIVLSHTQILTSTFTNEARFGASLLRTKFDIPYDKPLFEEFGIKGIPKTTSELSNNHGLSRFTPNGYRELGSRSFWPNFDDLTLYQASDVAFKSFTRHTLKFGVDFRKENVNRNAARFARGQFAFNREFTANPQSRGNTGDGMAEMLLGWASGGSLGNENGESLKANTISGFIQDDWKIGRRLTLNLGFRYDLFRAPTFDTPNGSNFVLSFDQLGPNARLKQIRPLGKSDCLCDQDYNNVAPRVGLAYQLAAHTVLRSGFGIVYGQADQFRTQISRITNQAPDFIEASFATVDRINPRLTLRDGFPFVQLPGTEVPGPNVVGVTSRPRSIPTQYSEQWFLDLQREMPFGIVMTLGYNGNGTHKLLTGFDHNLPFGPAATSVASRRLIPFYNGINSMLATGNLSYNALAWKMEKRFAKGLQFLSAYTFAHSIDNVNEEYNGTGGQGSINPYDRSLDRANSINDIRHSWVLSSIYELPVGKGKAVMNRGGVANALFGGWQLGGIVTMRTGLPFTVVSGGGLTNAGGEDRPIRLGEGSLPSDQRSIDRWFDVSAFALQPQYTYGNSGRNILRGPGYSNLDFTLQKYFPIGEKIRVQFRAEAFNATNTAHFDNPGANITAAGVGTINSAGEPRRIQFGLKVIY